MKIERNVNRNNTMTNVTTRVTLLTALNREISVSVNHATLGTACKSRNINLTIKNVKKGTTRKIDLGTALYTN